MDDALKAEIWERLKIASIIMNKKEFDDYVALPDDLGPVAKDVTLPVGYKRCGHCGKALKFFLFNKNNSTKNKCTGSCKECQRISAKKSYEKTKKKRNYKDYYAKNKDIKREAGKRYYQSNKDAVLAKQREYHASKPGRKVMQKSHGKRRKLLKANVGVPYTREIVIDRDSKFIKMEFPVCYLCGEMIQDISGIGLHLDHVIPVVIGGKDCLTNVACTHAVCNLQREKDARELTIAQIEIVVQRSEAYMDANPDKFNDAE